MINTATNKLYSLQILRAYAAILVVISYVWNNGILPGTFNELGGFGVDLFFVISGFIMCLTVSLKGSYIGNSKKFLQRRIIRIFPIYIITAIPLLLLNIKVDGLKEPCFYIGNLLLLPSFTNSKDYALVLGPGWSLVYEMFFYYVFATIMLFTKSKKKLIYSLILFLFLLVALVRLLGIQGPQLMLVNFSYIIGDTILFNFAFGMILYLIYAKMQGKTFFNIWQSLGILLLLTFIGASLIYLKMPRLLSNGVISLFIVFVFIFTNNFNLEDNKFLKWAVFLGDASYSIYLTHFYFQYFKQDFYNIAAPLNLDRSVMVNSIGILSVIFAVICGSIFYVLIEKNIIHLLKTKISK